MRIEFETSRYEFEHGHKPKGEGYWAFAIHDGYKSKQVFIHGKYGEAKKQASRQAKEIGANLVQVQP